MIVVDTNTIAYLYLPTEFTTISEALRRKAPDWMVPRLWRSEFRSVLSLYIRKEILSLNDAINIQEAAESLLLGREYETESTSILKLVFDSGCSAYDCEFASLAQALNCPVVTQDKKMLKAFPGLAISATDYLAL